jgi:hypothetical protein
MFYKVVDVAASANSKVEITSTMTLEVKKADRGGGISSGQMGYTFTAAPPVLAPRPVTECDPAAAALSKNTCEQPCIGMNALLMPMTGATGGETRIGQTVVCSGVARSLLDLDAHEKVRAWDRCERGQAWGKEITLEVPVTGGIIFQFPDSVFISAGSQKDKFLMHRYVREIALPVKVSCVGYVVFCCRDAGANVRFRRAPAATQRHLTLSHGRQKNRWGSAPSPLSESAIQQAQQELAVASRKWFQAVIKGSWRPGSRGSCTGPWVRPCRGRPSGGPAER